jgi:hypothetical protein
MIFLEVAVLVALFSAVLLLLDRWYKPSALLLALGLCLMMLAIVMVPMGLDICLQIVQPLSMALATLAKAAGYYGSEQWSAGGSARDCVILASLGYATMVYALVLTRCFGIFERRSD